jgi:hypothetical protein
MDDSNEDTALFAGWQYKGKCNVCGKNGHSARELRHQNNTNNKNKRLGTNNYNRAIANHAGDKSGVNNIIIMLIAQVMIRMVIIMWYIQSNYKQ